MSDRAHAGPLAGLRVIEFAGLGPTPFAAMLLADMGADVVRIERPGLRPLIPQSPDFLERGRSAVTLDLKTAQGRDEALELIARADAVIEGLRPGVMERLGLGPDPALVRQPALVYGRMTGWGQTGPLAQSAGHDINYIAITGALHAIGGADAPVPPMNLLGDFGGGSMYLVMGMLAALLHARATGVGQVVDAAIVDGTLGLMTMIYSLANAGVWRDARGENLLDGGAPFYGVYACKDGGHLSVGALEPQFYAAFVAGLGLDPADLPDQHDRAGWPRMRAAFAARIATKTRDEWDAVFAGTDACVAPVLSLAEAPAHPHNAARGAFGETGGALQPAAAPRFSHTPAVARPAGDGETVASVRQRWARPAP